MAATVTCDSGRSYRPVLSRLEDEELAGFARAGSREATEYLIDRYTGFVEGKARSYFLRGAEPEDVVQEGMIGLYKAIRDFRAEKDAHFRSFVELCVTRQIITAVKSATRNKHSVLNEYISLQHCFSSEDDGGCLLDVMADPRAFDPERIVMEQGVWDCVRDGASEDMSHLECEVLGRYLQGASYHDIAGEMGRPAKTIDNALQRAKRKAGRRLRELC